MQKQSATIVFNLEVNSLTESEIEKLASQVKISKSQMAAFILSQGFSNLKKRCASDSSKKLSFLP